MTRPSLHPAARAPRGARRIVHRLRRLADAGALLVRPRRAPRRAHGRRPLRHLAHGRDPRRRARAARLPRLRARRSTLGRSSSAQAKYTPDARRGRRHHRRPRSSTAPATTASSSSRTPATGMPSRDALAGPHRSASTRTSPTRATTRAHRRAGPARAQQILEQTDGLGIDDALAMGHTLGVPAVLHRDGHALRRDARCSSAAPATPAKTASSSSVAPQTVPATSGTRCSRPGAPLGLVPGRSRRAATRCASKPACRSTAMSSSLDIVPAQAGLGRVVAARQGRRTSSVAPASSRRSGASEAPVLVGLVSEGRRAGRAGYAVLDASGDRRSARSRAARSARRSGTRSPWRSSRPRRARPAPNCPSTCAGRSIPATVTALPFYRRNEMTDLDQPSSTPPSTSGSPSTATSPRSASPTTPPTSSATSSTSTCPPSARP